MDFSNKYILGFALAICLVCSLAVSSLAVVLDERIDANKRLDQQLNILRVAGMIEAGAHPTAEQANALFEDIEILLVSSASGAIEGEIPAEEFGKYDMYKASKDPQLSTAIDPAKAPRARGVQLSRIPDKLVVYKVVAEGHECYVFPFWGNGLWSTMKGFLALESDLRTVKGLTYAEHGETAGLGGEVDNPVWKAQWPGKRVYGDDGKVALDVVKFGKVNDPAHQVDGISGATITSVAVGAAVQVWLGEQGYGPYLAAVRGEEQ